MFFVPQKFNAILDHISDEHQAIQVANRIHKALAPPVLLQGAEVTIGIVLDDPKYTDLVSIIRDADIAMYEAKNNDFPYVVFDG